MYAVSILLNSLINLTSLLCFFVFSGEEGATVSFMARKSLATTYAGDIIAMRIATTFMYFDSPLKSIY